VIGIVVSFLVMKIYVAIFHKNEESTRIRKKTKFIISGSAMANDDDDDDM